MQTMLTLSVAYFFLILTIYTPTYIRKYIHIHSVGNLDHIKCKKTIKKKKNQFFDIFSSLY